MDQSPETKTSLVRKDHGALGWRYGWLSAATGSASRTLDRSVGEQGQRTPREAWLKQRVEQPEGRWATELEAHGNPRWWGLSMRSAARPTWRVAWPGTMRIEMEVRREAATASVRQGGVSLPASLLPHRTPVAPPVCHAGTWPACARTVQQVGRARRLRCRRPSGNDWNTP